MHRIGKSPIWLVVAVLMGLLLIAGSARAGIARQDATEPAATAASTLAPITVESTAVVSAAETPAAEPPPAETPAAEPAATDATPAAAAATEPAAEPEATAAPTDVITLVAWYSLDPSGEFLNVYPLATNEGQVAGQNGDAIGQIVFPEEGLPVVTLGDSRFDAYLRYEGDPNNGQRWVWFNDEDGVRPATLIIQIAGVEGSYLDHYGTASLISRDEGSAGGVLVLALRPPDAPAEEEAAEAETEAEAEEEAEPAAEEAPATEEAGG